jgi:hypothetical protein
MHSMYGPRMDLGISRLRLRHIAGMQRVTYTVPA